MLDYDVVFVINSWISVSYTIFDFLQVQAEVVLSREIVAITLKCLRIGSESMLVF